jgi:hypothetical protein
VNQSSAIRRYDRVSRRKPLDSQRSGRTSSKMSTETLPLLLPASVLGLKSESDPQEWEPSRHLQVPQPPPKDDSKQHDLEMAAARQLIDGKAFKKVRPRRTVDYFAGMGRWTLVSFCLFALASRDLTGTIVAQDIVGSTVSTVHEASGAVYNRCMEPFRPDAPVPVSH